MRLLSIILCSIFILTSCKSSFTKRHYRPGIFREHIKDVHSTAQTNSPKKERAIPVVINNQDNKSVFSYSNTDTLPLKEYEDTHKNHKKSLKDPHLIKKLFKRNFINGFKTSYNIKKEESSSNIEKLKKVSRILGWGAIICVIAFGIIVFLAVTAELDLYVWLSLLFLDSLIGAILILAFLILKFIIQIRVNKQIKEENKNLNSHLKKFFRNLRRLSSLNWLCPFFTAIGLFVFIVYRDYLIILIGSFLLTGVIMAFLMIGFHFSLVYHYNKCKTELTEEQKRKYRITKNISTFIELILLAIFALFLIGFLFL